MNIAKNNVKQNQKIIVVEWYMDVIWLYRAGVPVWVAPCGTSLTWYHIKLIKRVSHNVLLSFDSDDAGINATIRSLKMAWQEDIFPKILKLPNDYKDVDEYVNSSQELQFEEEDGFVYILEKLLQSIDLYSPIDRKKLSNQVFDMLSNIKDYSIFSFYLNLFAKKISINYDILFNQFKIYLKSQRSFSKAHDSSQTNENDWKSTNYVLCSLFYNDFLKQNVKDIWQVQPLVDFLIELGSYYPNELLQKTIDNDLTDEQKQNILQNQMRRERQLETLKVDKTQNIIKSFLKNEIHKITKEILRSKNTDSEQKQNLLQKIKEIEKI